MRGVAAFSLAVLLAAAFATMAGSGPHTLHAQGAHGWVKFWADGPGTVRVAGKGSLTVENASNQQMKVDGTWGEMRKLPDGGAYTHFEGSVECIGIGAHIEMRGWAIELSAKGKGRAHFQGEGTVQVDDGPAVPWPDPMTEHGWLKVHYGK